MKPKGQRGAKLLNSSSVLAKIAKGDMIPAKAKYYGNCLSRFYTDIKNINIIPHLESKNNPFTYGIVLSETINFMKNIIKNCPCISTGLALYLNLVNLNKYETKNLLKLLTNLLMFTAQD